MVQYLLTPDQIVLSKSFNRGENSINKLVDCLRRWLKFCDGENQKYRDLKKVLGTKEREQLLRSSAKKCCLCKSEIESDAVIHHNHATSEVYGLAHSKSNLKARTVKFLPVFFHNVARYDAHHNLKFLQLRPNEILSAIARTGEIFISFSIKIQSSEYTTKQGAKKPIYNEIRFLDSFQFLSQGLDGLAKTMKLGDLKHLRSKFSYLSDANFSKLRGKSAFPYCYLDCLTKFSASFPLFGNDWKNSLSGKKR